jgi:hypothetical protein
MSTEIHAGPISATRFWGGKDRGVCIQITGRWKSADYGAGLFVQGEYADVVECAKAIVAFDAAERHAVDGVPAGEATTTAPAPAGTPALPEQVRVQTRAAGNLIDAARSTETGDKDNG